jgi:hypothetical protein
MVYLRSEPCAIKYRSEFQNGEFEKTVIRFSPSYNTTCDARLCYPASFTTIKLQPQPGSPLGSWVYSSVDLPFYILTSVTPPCKDEYQKMMSTSAYSTAMALLQFSLVAAYPVKETAHLARDDASPVVLGKHAVHRTIVVVVCMSYAVRLALT